MKIMSIRHKSRKPALCSGPALTGNVESEKKREWQPLAVRCAIDVNVLIKQVALYPVLANGICGYGD